MVLTAGLQNLIMVGLFVTPIVYAQFGAQFRMLLANGLIPEQFVQFGGGDIFSLPAAVALGLAGVALASNRSSQIDGPQVGQAIGCA